MSTYSFRIFGKDPTTGESISRMVMIDRKDKGFISQFEWKLKPVSGTHKDRYHAVREVSIGGRKQTIRMHRVLSEASRDTRTIHLDGNTLNNRRSNLSQRKLNPWTGRDSGFRGVHQIAAGRWTASIEFAGIDYTLTPKDGVDNPVKAAVLYNEAATKLYGTHASLNEV